MAAMKNTFQGPEKLEEYKDAAARELAQELSSLGFKEFHDGLGGDAQIIEQVIAYINVHDFWFPLFVGIVANRIDKLISLLLNWNKRNRIKRSKMKQVVYISLYSKFVFKESISIKIDLDKGYSRSEIVTLIKKTGRRKR